MMHTLVDMLFVISVIQGYHCFRKRELHLSGYDMCLNGASDKSIQL